MVVVTSFERLILMVIYLFVFDVVFVNCDLLNTFMKSLNLLFQRSLSLFCLMFFWWIVVWMMIVRCFGNPISAVIFHVWCNAVSVNYDLIEVCNMTLEVLL